MILAIVQEGFDAHALLPGGSLELPGYDPNYSTNPLYQSHDLSPGDSDTEHKFELAAGETRNFELSISQTQDDAATTVTGIQLNAPSGATVYATVIGPSPDGGTRTLSLSTDDVGSPVGRFSQGHILVRGTVENGNTPGSLELVYGAPQDQADLPGGGSDETTVEDPDIETGTTSLHVDDSGVYLVVVTTRATIDNLSATLGGYAGGGYVITTPSAGPVDSRGIPSIATGTIE